MHSSVGLANEMDRAKVSQRPARTSSTPLSETPQEKKRRMKKKHNAKQTLKSERKAEEATTTGPFAQRRHTKSPNSKAFPGRKSASQCTGGTRVKLRLQRSTAQLHSTSTST
jgi:hypothetical protein